MRARRAFSLFNDVPLRTRRVLLLYKHTKSMSIAPFWFSLEYCWTALTPFWLSTDNTFLHSYSKSVIRNKLEMLFIHMQFHIVLILYTPYISRGFYFREFNNTRKYLPSISTHECDLCMQCYSSTVHSARATQDL